MPTEVDKGYDRILDNIVSLYRDLARAIDNAPHTFGMGTPGAISPRTGLLKNSNTVVMNGKPVKADLEQRLQRPIEIQNDANCFAMAEAMHGAGQGKAMVFGVIMGTGCGGGLVHNGHVHTGIQAIGGEWGHMSIDPNGPKCYCGNNGCVECYISGGGLTRRYAERYNDQKPLLEVENAYFAGEPRAVEFLQTFFVNFGRSMANLINILDPDIIVLGGGFSKFKAIYTEGIKEVQRQVFSDSLETPIVKHQIGDSAGVLGAAYIGI
ncbi:MAG TPA: N-acetylglucosamine kinase [Verrucomicrobia bacterium]|nr:N-acetylglucosamine kinase [Verrucomicrobiota bacterium]